MGFQIQDGTGKGYLSGVDSKNRLLTATINETAFEHAAEIGDAYFIGTPIITLTNANTSAIFFLENQESRPLILGEFFINAEQTGATTNSFRVNFVKNPTTIGPTFSATTPLNQNFGSSNELDSIAYYGAQGSGVSGGPLVATLTFQTGQFNRVPANLVLEKGSSVGISIQPQTGNTNLAIQFAARTILFDRN